MCCACSWSISVKFGVNPVCVRPMKKQFGKPWLKKPWNVLGPSAHFSVIDSPSRPYVSKPLRRDQLKPVQAIQKLTEGTGGRILSVNDSRDAAKSICDELRKNRYVLAYTPTSLPLYDARRLLVLANDGITIRHKLQQPGN